MSLASRAGDLYYAFRFVKLLTTKWEETDAYKLGLIDANGKRIKSEKLDTSEKKTAYTPFIRLAYNIKRLLEKLPGGSSTISSYAAALFLLKEEFGLSDKSIDKIMKLSEIDPIDLMSEDHRWFELDDGRLSPGMYRVKNEKVLSKNLEDVVNAKDQIRVSENAYPVGEICGVPIYEAIHANTGQKVHVSVGELIK